MFKRNRMVSFARRIGGRLTHIIHPSGRDEDKRLLTLLHVNNTVIAKTRKGGNIRFSAKGDTITHHILIYLGGSFGLVPSTVIQRKQGLHGGGICALAIQPSTSDLQFLKRVKLSPLVSVHSTNQLISTRRQQSCLTNTFLNNNAIDQPRNSCRLRLIARSLQFTKRLVTIVHSFGLGTHVASQGGSCVICVGNNSSIDSFLRVINTTGDCVSFRDIHIIGSVQGHIGHRMGYRATGLRGSISTTIHRVQSIRGLLRCGQLSRLSPSIHTTYRTHVGGPSTSVTRLTSLYNVAGSKLTRQFHGVTSVTRALTKGTGNEGW